MSWNNSDACNAVVHALQHEKLVVSASDTVPGLLAPLTALGRCLLDEAKDRSGKPYLILIESSKKLPLFVADTNHFVVLPLIQACWPGPLTIIFKARADLPGYIVSEDGRVAIRVPSHTGLQEVLFHFDGLFSTSANRAGHPVPASVADVNTTLREKAACVVTEANTNMVKPSTIIDCSGDYVRIVREGAYSRSTLQDYLHKPIQK